MPSPEKKLIDLYAYRMDGTTPRFLLLQRSGQKIYAGQWRMIGGKVKTGEMSWEAARRELLEETALHPVTFWTVPTLNHFYEASTDSVHLIPPFAAEIDPEQKIILNDEHTGFRWASLEEAESAVFWPEQVRILQLINRLLQTNKILEEWKLPAGS
ncbi:MAG: NUDIX domain-containing protein [Balneolaceae bacterium]